MKKLIIISIFAFSGIALKAQFKNAILQASGLTCAMCTKAINTSLEELSFIGSVKADIKNSAFNIVFKPGIAVDIDALKKAVEDAGFSVAKLKLSGTFLNLAVKNDEHVQLNGKTFHFINVKDQTLDGDNMITIIDKNFLTAKEFKKYSAATGMDCIQPGRRVDCCQKGGTGGNSRIYHATINTAG